jgi:hypothetical protein
MARRPPPPSPVPPPLPDDLCRTLPFANPDRGLRRRLLDRETAARRNHTQLTAAECAALARLHHATTVMSHVGELLRGQRRQPIATRALHGDDEELVLALLWRARRHPGDPYGVQLARHIGGHLTLLSPTHDLRVDAAWPLYHQQCWPPHWPH